MLERYYQGTGCLRRLRVGPFGDHTDGLAERFYEQGYPRERARVLLHNASHLSHYLLWRGIGKVEGVRPEHIEAFFREHLPNCACDRPNSGAFESAPVAVRYMVEFLRERGLLHGFESVEVPPDSVAGVLMRYQAYLEKIRGLSKCSRALHRSLIQRFLDARQNRLGALKLADLTPGEVLEYCEEALATPHSPARKNSVMHCLRVFMRFLCWDRLQTRDLSRAVPSLLRWRLAEVPKHLPWTQVRLLLGTPDTRTPQGKRDRAILMVLALLGLRAGELTALTLDHVHWREGRLTVPQGKGRRQRSLPLPPEAAKVLSDYVRGGRPQAHGRILFMRSRPPLGRLSTGGIGSIVRKYILQAGIKEAPKKGSHVLRHSLATCLINRGVPVKQIADILGHSDINTTGIYAKVDVRRLSEVALPFPVIEEA